MIVYSSTRGEFSKDVDNNIIESEVKRQFISRLKRRPSDAEVNSWRNSLPYMDRALEMAKVPENSGVAIEYMIPSTAKRVDFLISGCNRDRQDSVVIVELKQWSRVDSTSMNGLVKTFVGGGNREVTHPSYQAWSYQMFIEDFNTEVQRSNIKLNSCSYLHNCTDTSRISTPFYERYLHLAPMFGRRQVGQLCNFISQHIESGDDADIITRIEKSKLEPSKHLVEHIAKLLAAGEETFVLLDDQKIVYEKVLDLARKANRPNASKKQVALIEGGPGTGKTVLAINLLAQILSYQFMCQYVTQNSAPREVFKQVLKGNKLPDKVDNLFVSPEKFVDRPNSPIGALLVDESHRLRKKSGFYSNKGENQIKELIQASNLSVFFIDDDQSVTSKDYGSADEIRAWANDESANLTELKLESQFRCNGSDGYLAWVTHALQIRGTANPTLDGIDYDFRVFDCPNQLRDQIKEKYNNNLMARMLAGYCWDWVSKKGPNKDEYDVCIEEHGFKMRWNLIDHGQAWIIQPDSISEIGCVYTSQGLELDYVGVIIGPDLLVRNGTVEVDGLAHAGTDAGFGLKGKLKKKDPDAIELADKLTRNIYRVLMTRGLKGCYVFCVDKETNEYFKNYVC